jgi:MFS superfamily sulfate permease-like transporter
MLLAILKIGSITKYLSDALLRGFTTAAAIHIVTSQLKHVFGIYEPVKKQAYFQIINV